MDGERGPSIISSIERAPTQSSRPVLLPNGPDAPTLIRNEKDARTLASLELTIKKVNKIYTREDQVAFNERLEAQLAIERVTLSPQTVQHRQRVMLIWKTVLNMNGVDVPDNEIFVLDHIRNHARKYIYYVVSPFLFSRLFFST